jgi:hypothetical protein
MRVMDAPDVTPAAARQFVKALADGVPPHSPLTRWLTVGQEELLAGFDADLTAVAAGEFRSLMLLGNPGAGKSQLLITLQYLAAGRGFVTAYFSQDVQSRLAFNRPDQVYRRIVETMRLPDDPQGRADPLRRVIDAWVDRALPQLRGTNRSMSIAYKLSQAGLLPPDAQGVDYRTRVALVGYLMASEQQNEDARVQFLNALRGPGLTNTQVLEVAWSINLVPRGRIGWTPSPYDAGHYFSLLRTLVFIMRAIGHRGMVALFDEVTAIVDLRARSREKAYKVLDSLFFNDYVYEGLYTVFAYMPPFITQLQTDRWRTSEDYAERWSDLWGERMREIGALDDRELNELLRRLAYLHGVARGWPAWPSVAADARGLVKGSRRNGVGTRDLVKTALKLLDERYALQSPSPR